MGLPAADSVVDRSIPTFSRGELPHFASINTFLNQHFLKDVRQCGNYDVAILGAPFDGGTTYRAGARFGLQGIRKISALYGPYSFELSGDHSLGYPTTRAVAEHLGGGNLGIIHFDRHVDTQDTDLDERMHTTPWFHATNLPNMPPKNLVQIGIGGWQAPRDGVKVSRERGTTIMTVTDCSKWE